MPTERLVEIVDPISGVPTVVALVLAPVLAYIVVRKAAGKVRARDALLVALAVALLGGIGLSRL